MLPTQADFLAEIYTAKLNLTDIQTKQAAKFAEILHRENQKQNLTRILGIKEFVSGHLLDVVELMKANWLESSVMDIGSGGGVPGLLAAAIDQDESRRWDLCDSEQSKAVFLSEAATELGLSNRVFTFSQRVEEIIQARAPKTVVARAVGTVDKIAAWIWNCSTWNNLILFKSTGWGAEWEEAKKTKFGKKLTVTQIQEYSSNGKYRVLINLVRK